MARTDSKTICYFADGKRAELIEDQGNGWVTVQYETVVRPCSASDVSGLTYRRGKVADRRAEDIIDRFEVAIRAKAARRRGA